MISLVIAFVLPQFLPDPFLVPREVKSPPCLFNHWIPSDVLIINSQVSVIGGVGTETSLFDSTTKKSDIMFYSDPKWWSSQFSRFNTIQ